MVCYDPYFCYLMLGSVFELDSECRWVDMEYLP